MNVCMYPYINNIYIYLNILYMKYFSFDLIEFCFVD